MVAAGNPPPLHERLDELVQCGLLADLDRHFATLVGELDIEVNPLVVLAAAVLSAEHRDGHTCLLLDRCAGRPIAEVLTRSRESAAGTDAPVSEERLPDERAWRNALARSSMVATPDDDAEAPAAGGEPLPLVLDGAGRLYLHRLFDAERFLAERLRELASARPSASDGSPSLLRGLFVDDAQEEQLRAARIAASRRLCIVTGGPGTGKTTLAARIVAQLVHSGLAQPRRIALAAPTGKAAARLQQSMGTQLEDLAAKVPALGDHVFSASTLHRLLNAVRRGGAAFDALVVDECSMVDLSLMRSLVDELPPNVRLILLGDASQLASVQPGRVFGDICAAGGCRASPLHECFVKLTKNHRFDAEGGIGRMAAAVVDGKADEAVAALRDGGAELARCDLAKATEFEEFARCYAAKHIEPLVEKLQACDKVKTPFPSVRVLCAHRTGAFGTERFNDLVKDHLRERRLIEDDATYYVGRPIIVTRNDPDTELSNGDTGVVVPGDGEPRVWFPELDARREDGGRFLVSPIRLPEHESFFALNVHRAQGSEYEEVAYVPGLSTSRIASRELLYTALTRAKSKVVVYGCEEAIRAATNRVTTRASGLQARLTSG